MTRISTWLTRAVVLAGLALGAGTAKADIVVIDFNDLVGTDLTDQGFTVSEDGFTLNNLSGAFPFLSVHPENFRYTGTVSLLNDTIGGITELVQTNGDPFDLISIDLAELNGDGVVSVTFIGNLVGGGTVTQTFTLDGDFPELQTFFFDGFTNLTSVTWSQDSPFHQFDNIVINNEPGSAVPEPGSLALVGLGLASLAGYGWRRKNGAPAAA